MSSFIPSNPLANLAPTLFQAGAQDIVAAPDIYSINSNSIINTSAGKFNPFSGSLLNNLRNGTAGILGSLTQTVNFALTTGQSLSSPQTLARLGASLGQSLGNYSPAIQTALDAGLRGANPVSTLLQVGLGSSGAYNLIQSNNILDAQNVLGLVNQVTGNSRFVSGIDIGTQAGILSGLTSSLITLGLPLVLQSLLSDPSTAPRSAQVALGNNVRSAIYASDLTTIQLCITTLGIGGILSQMPDAALQLVANYRLPSGTTPTGYAAIYSTFKGILTQLDPSWDTANRNGVSIPSLRYFSVASKDALKLFATDTTEALGAQLGNTYRSQDVVAQLKQQYPAMLVTP